MIFIRKGDYGACLSRISIRGCLLCCSLENVAVLVNFVKLFSYFIAEFHISVKRFLLTRPNLTGNVPFHNFF
jgi:hypothetical protein